MTTDTSDKIVGYIKKNRQVTAKGLTDYLGISKQALFKQLAKLLKNDLIYKIGKPPTVFYLIKESYKRKTDNAFGIDHSEEKIINDRFLAITPAGERKEGIDGFIYWCQKTDQPIVKTAKEYIKTLAKYDAFKKNDLIDGIKKIKSSFDKVSLDSLFYLDFYSIERFGKTKLGQMLLYAKQSQNRSLIKELVSDISPFISRIIKKYNINAIGFIPPTVKREVQFMRELQGNLNFDIPVINLVKIRTEIIIPQKTLTKLDDRVENAKGTIIADEKRVYKNILLIDDAVGSGATLNETAAQIKSKKLCKGKIIGLAITGSFKGFDVISEV